MTSVIVVLPKADDARNMKNLLVRNGISVAGACTTGAQALAMADGLQCGVIICSHKLQDMMYTQLLEDIPFDFDLLLLASHQVLANGGIARDVMCLSMPLKVHDLINTVDMMLQAIERRWRHKRTKPRERNAEETALINSAKEVLMNRNHMSEEEAHRYLQKCSMDSGTSMVETAHMVLMMMRS